MLADLRSRHEELAQLILRPGTILGADVHNQITDLFDGSYVLGVRGAQTPFVLVWDRDVVGAILHGIRSGGVGIYNLAGDGTIALGEIAGILGKPYILVPAMMLSVALGALHKL